MSDDYARNDEDLTAELGAIDACLQRDSVAALKTSLAGSLWQSGFDTVARLMRRHRCEVTARRAEIVALLADAALPRRLRCMDELLTLERDHLAEARELYAGTPGPAPGDTERQKVHARLDQIELRQRIDQHLREISYLAAYRAEVAARLRAIGECKPSNARDRIRTSIGGLHSALVG